MKVKYKNHKRSRKRASVHNRRWILEETGDSTPRNLFDLGDEHTMKRMWGNKFDSPQHIWDTYQSYMMEYLANIGLHPVIIQEDHVWFYFDNWDWNWQEGEEYFDSVHYSWGV